MGSCQARSVYLTTCRKYFMISLYKRMLLTSAGVEPANSWSPVGRRIQLSHRGRLSEEGERPQKWFHGVPLPVPTLFANVAGLDGSVGSPSDWRPEGRGFNPRWGRQHSFVEIGQEIFSTVILSTSVDSRRVVISFWRKDVHNTG